MLEKCFHCSYDGEKLSAPCAFHANPDETTHGGIVAGVEGLVLEQLELAIEPHGPPEVIGEPPCDACTRGAFCLEHSGKTRRPYVAPAITDVTDPEKARELALGFGIDLRADRGHSPIELVRARELDDLAVLVDDEAPKTPRDRGAQ